MFGDLIDLDFSGDSDWLSTLADLGTDLSGNLGEWFVDSVTGEIVSAADAEALDLSDLDLSGSGSGPVTADPFDGSLDTSPISTSKSDILRSLEGSPTTWAPGSEPFDLNAMADPTASIASAAGGTDWAKMLAQALKSGLGALGGTGAPSGAGGNAGGKKDDGLPSIPVMGAPTANVGMPGGFSPLGGGVGGGVSAPSAGGLGGLDGLGMQGGVSALLSRLQADPGARLGLQAPIDAGPIPRPFTPLVIPTTPGGAPMAQAPGARMSGLQRLLLERLG